MKKFIIPIILLVLMTAILFAGVLWFYFAKVNDPSTEAKPAEKEYSEIYALGDSFITNARDVSNCLIKTTITLQIGEKKKTEFLDGEVTFIRDKVISILRSKTKEEMCQVDIQEQLSTEICNALNAEYGVTFFKKALFSDFIVQ